MGVERQRSQRVPEEASAQREDLVGLVGGLPRAGGLGLGGQPRGLGAVDPLELPGDMHGAVDELALDLSAGLELGGPGVAVGAEGVGVLAGQDRQPCGHPVLDCIEPRSALTGH